MDFAPLIARKKERFAELEGLIGSGEAYADPRKSRDILREHTRLKELLADWQSLEKARADFADNTELAKGTDELAELAQSEIPELADRIAELERDVQFSLLPPDPNEDKDAIVEIRAGAGGDEAGLFAADLWRMYNRFAEAVGLKVEPLESSPGELGGFKEVIFKLSGEGVFRKLRYESGVHRVQRVPCHRGPGPHPHEHCHGRRATGG
jgi:peptide chain release factor 1